MLIRNIFADMWIKKCGLGCIMFHYSQTTCIHLKIQEFRNISTALSDYFLYENLNWAFLSTLMRDNNKIVLGRSDSLSCLSTLSVLK